MQLIKDRYERIMEYLRISVTDQCNLRCIYCMPPQGITPIADESLLSFEEILRVVRIAGGLGVRKVRITGGEPLVRKNLPSLIEAMSQIEGIDDISLTTNGLLLEKYACALVASGLKRVNVSLDSLVPDRFKEITRGGCVSKVVQGILRAEEAGLFPVKINMIPLKGVNDDEIEVFAGLTLKAPYHVRFIELMPFGGGNGWRDKYLSTDEIKTRVSTIAPLVPVKLQKSGPARYFRFEGAQGTIGFISPLTHHFCNSCNRLRLTSDGKLRPCLFSEAEIDLKSAIRSGASDSEIKRLLKLSVEIKPERHHLDSSNHSNSLASLSRIGG